MTDPTAVPAELVAAGPVLVTGAGGFLGGNLVWTLRTLGFAVRALVRRPPHGPQWDGLDGVEFVLGDVRNPVQVARAMTGVHAVIHAAGLTNILPRPRALAFQVNVGGTRNVCEAARRAGVRRLIFTSSIGTIPAGTADKPANESIPFRPSANRSPYHLSKWQAEQVVREVGARGLETITFCPGYIIGPRDVRPTTNALLLEASHYPFMPLPPGGMNVIDVRAVALAHGRALWLGTPGARYLLAGPYHAYAELGRMVHRVVGLHSPPATIPRWSRWPGTMTLALLSPFQEVLPEGLSWLNFKNGFEAYHVSGAQGDQTFHLRHRPVIETVADTLRWFQETGLAPWLREPLHKPE